jgi:hypothetical protein
MLRALKIKRQRIQHRNYADIKIKGQKHDELSFIRVELLITKFFFQNS